MANYLRELRFHDSDGNVVQVKADEVLAVEETHPLPRSQARTRILLSGIDGEGKNEELLVREAAEIVTQKLRDANSVGNWQGA